MTLRFRHIVHLPATRLHIYEQLANSGQLRWGIGLPDDVWGQTDVSQKTVGYPSAPCE